MQLSVGLCAHLLLNWLAAAICLEDKNKECAQWAANGECEKNVNFIHDCAVHAQCGNRAPALLVSTSTDFPNDYG